ncbi:MAG: helicase-related protein [Trueperaceae bacterium]
MTVDTRVNPKPEVVTNRHGKTVATALQTYWDYLHGSLKVPPSLAIATAYFNPGGFRLLADQLEQAQGVRLLLGAEPDVAADLHRLRSLKPEVLPEDEDRVRLLQALREHHQRMEVDRDLTAFDPTTDHLIERLIAWLRSANVEVRRLSRRFLHGKAYIVETGPDGVLAGSSNLTQAGLTSNIELNLGNYQPGVVGEVLEWFDELWGEAEVFDLAHLYEQRFEEHTPYQIYLRMLWERYHDELRHDEPVTGLHLTAFQRDGLYRALDYLQKHSGVMIADGVGLGKTYLAGELLRRAVQDRRQRALLIAPAALRDGPWETFLREFDLKNVQCVSFQELISDARLGGDGGYVLWHDPAEYALVVIDEAHAYRNPDTDRAATLRRLLEGTPRKEVVLLTATPVNNSLWDLYNVLSYFIRNDAQFLPAGVPSLRRHFAEAEAEDPNDLSPDKLFDVLDAVAVRRTRRFVKKFYPHERIRKGNVELTITFPQPIVQRVAYELSGTLPDYFARFAHAIGIDPEDEDSPLPSPTEFDYGEQLTLARYVPTAYVKGNGAQAYELQAAGLLRSGLLKRFESSTHAFAMTCRKMASSHDDFLAALEDGWVLTGEALAAWNKTDSDEFDPAEIEKGRVDSAVDYDVDSLREAVTADRDLLLVFAAEADEVTLEQDPKLDALVDELAEIAKQAHEEATDEIDERNKRKVIVFSYFADTVAWIVDRLEQAVQTDPRLAVYRGRLARVTGSTGNTKDALLGFAPVSSDAPADHPDKYDLLVATDILAEGVNLQQARHIINYDLPWNPMRLVQRHGRIDRIGSPHKRVYLRCFFPSRELDQLLKLEATLQRKITQAAKSIGVEGEIVPGSKGSEQVYAHTQEQIQQLLREDPTLFEEGLDVGALSGEEFRQELSNAMSDPDLRSRILELPWTSGSGKTTVGTPGYVFCARVADDPNPRYRWVPLSAEQRPDSNGIQGDTLACLAQAVSEMNTARKLPAEMKSLAYDAWKIAQKDILEEWIVATDPRSLKPAIPKPMRDAAAVLREHRPQDMSNERFHRLLDTIEAPYDTRTQRLIRKAINDHHVPSDQVEAIIGVVEDLGLQPPEEIKPLPEITLEDVHLVCWMALVPEAIE